MRILVTGGKGQLGRALQRVLVQETTLFTDLEEMDITDFAATRQVITEFNPTVVIHGAAHTNVDGCELNPDAAYLVNALGTQYVALACQAVGAAMVYVSTNCVFDGTKTTPYLEFDLPNPISVYGASKLAGERIVQSVLNRFYIVRTSWLYGEGGRNFPNTVIKLAEERDSLDMVNDEVSSPTYAFDLAQALARLIDVPAYGIYHLSNAGACSRYEFAAEALRLAGKGDFCLRPISLRDYVRPSKPPLYSPLRNFCAARLGIEMRPWQEALRDFVCSSQ
ncbi:MAG: dTDP-4-dehydrorhamnose reductase [Chloroflexota bacterium]